MGEGIDGEQSYEVERKIGAMKERGGIQGRREWGKIGRERG